MLNVLTPFICICILILGWPEGSFGFPITSYGKTPVEPLADPVKAERELVLDMFVA